MSDGAATISIDCPGCGKRFSVAAQHAGKKGKCKSCGTSLTVPSLPPKEPEDTYDIADDEQPAKPVKTASIAQPQAAPAATGPVLAYSAPSPRTVKAAGKKGEYDPYDHFEGNRFKNLYFPLILILGTAVFNLIAEAFLKHNASMGIAAASVQMIAKLAVEIPCMLIACVLAVKLLDAAFGPLGPAILKLSSIALAPDAVMDLIVLIMFLIGLASHNAMSMAVDVIVGVIVGWGLSLAFYFWLFMYYFELEFADTWKLALFIWFIRMALAWLASMVFLAWLFH